MDDQIGIVDTRDFLQEMCAAAGVAGTEDSVGDIVTRCFRPLIDDVLRDAMGNVIMRIRGSAEDPPAVMVAAHMDEIGLIVTKVEERGFLRFAPVGGVDPRNLLAAEVQVMGRECLPGVIGVKPPHLISAEERKRAIEMKDMYIDVGLDGEAARELVQVGDMIALRRQTQDLAGDRMAGKAMDDRAGVATLYEAAQKLDRLRCAADVYLVATVQEEVGLRGAMISTYEIMPDVGIAADVTVASSPGIPPTVDVQVGEGPVLAQGANIHPHLYGRLLHICKEERIPHQMEIEPGHSGTDAWGMQVTKSGVPTAVVSIPLRYMHTTVEMLSESDIKNSGALLAHFAASVDREFLEGFYEDSW